MSLYLIDAKLKNGGAHVFLARNIRFYGYYSQTVGLELLSKDRRVGSWKRIETQFYETFTIRFDLGKITEEEVDAYINLNQVCYDAHLKERKEAKKKEKKQYG